MSMTGRNNFTVVNYRLGRRIPLSLSVYLEDSTNAAGSTSLIVINLLVISTTASLLLLSPLFIFIVKIFVSSLSAI